MVIFVPIWKIIDICKIYYFDICRRGNNFFDVHFRRNAFLFSVERWKEGMAGRKKWTDEKLFPAERSASFSFDVVLSFPICT